MILVQRVYDEMDETSQTLLHQTASHPLLLEEAEEEVEDVVLLEEPEEMVLLEEPEEMVLLEEAETQVSVSACLKHAKIYLSS